MIRLLLAFLLLLSSAGVFAEEQTASEIYPDPSAIPLSWALRQLPPGDTLREIVKAEQYNYARDILRRNEFLKFYETVLTECHTHEIDAGPFIEATSGFLNHLELSYEELLSLVHSAAPTPEAARALGVGKANQSLPSLTKNQGLLLNRLLKNQGPQNVRELIELARSCPQSSEMAAYLFPKLTTIPLSESFRKAVYRDAIQFYSTTESVSEFTKKTAHYFHQVDFSPSQILLFARSIKIPMFDQKDFPRYTFAAADFLAYHLEHHSHSLGISRFIELSKAIQNEFKQACAEIEAICEIKKIPWPKMPYGRYEYLSRMASADNLRALFNRLIPETISPETAPQLSLIVNHLKHLQENEFVIQNRLKKWLRESRDPQSFVAVLLIDPASLRMDADKRFAEFVSWAPEMETLLQAFGGGQIQSKYITASITPNQFVEFLLEAIKQDFWDDPQVFEDFLLKELPRFLSMSPAPTYEEQMKVLAAIRHRPVEKARNFLEVEIAKTAAAVPGEDVLEANLRKRLFLNFVLHELNTCAVGKLCFDLQLKTDRRKARERLRELVTPAISSYYPGVSVTEQEALLFRDLLMHDEVEDKNSILRFLAMLRDDVSPDMAPILLAAMEGAPTSLKFGGDKPEVIRQLSAPQTLINAPPLPSSKFSIRSVCEKLIRWPKWGMGSKR